MTGITREELAARLGEPGLRVVDVLGRDSYRAVHLRGAASLPVAEVEARAAALLPDRGQEIVLYCGRDT